MKTKLVSQIIVFLLMLFSLLPAQTGAQAGSEQSAVAAAKTAVSGYAAPLKTGARVSLTTWHSDGSLDRIAYDWRYETGDGNRAVFAPHAGTVKMVNPYADSKTKGWVQIYDEVTNMCINILHLDRDIKVSVNQKVTIDTQLGTYTSADGHTHMGVIPGNCAGTYAHSQEVSVVFQELGEVPSQRITLGTRVYVIARSTASLKFVNGGSTPTVTASAISMKVSADNLNGKTFPWVVYRPPFAGLPEEILRGEVKATSNTMSFTILNNPIPGATYFPVVSLQSITDEDARKQRSACYSATGGVQLCDKVGLAVPTYGAVTVSKSENPTVAAGGSIELLAKFGNSGTTAWSNGGNNPARIGLVDPATNKYDSVTPFVCPDWIGSTRPAALSDTSVASEGTGTFKFKICVPEATTPGTYRIAVMPLVEGITWMPPVNGVPVWEIKVDPAPTVLSASTSLSALFIEEGEVTEVVVGLNKAESVTAAEVACTLDPLLEISGITNGGQFGEQALLAVNGPQNGLLKIGLAPANSAQVIANGEAVRFTLKAPKAGQYAVDCKVRVSKGDNSLTEIPSSSATLTVNPPIVPPKTGTTSGTVNAGKTVMISLLKDSSLAANISANSDGSFRLDIEPGIYTIVAEAAGFMKAQGTITIVAGQSVAMPAISLIPGDINGDTQIDGVDVIAIGANYGNASPAAADLNDDGEINVLDLEVLARNYRLAGPSEWK